MISGQAIITSGAGMSANFETVEFVRTLIASGVPPAQAEAMARAFTKSMKAALENQTASKSDVQALSGDIQSLNGEIKTELKSLRNDVLDQVQSEIRSLLIWMLFGLAFISLIVILARIVG